MSNSEEAVVVGELGRDCEAAAAADDGKVGLMGTYSFAVVVVVEEEVGCLKKKEVVEEEEEEEEEGGLKKEVVVGQRCRGKKKG